MMAAGGADKRLAEVAVDTAEFRSRDVAVGKRHRGQERRQVEHPLLGPGSPESRETIGLGAFR